MWVYETEREKKDSVSYLRLTLYLEKAQPVVERREPNHCANDAESV